MGADQNPAQRERQSDPEAWDREAYRRQLRRAIYAERERDAYRTALENLMRFAHRLMESESEDERGIGCCIAEGARVVEEGS